MQCGCRESFFLWADAGECMNMFYGMFCCGKGAFAGFF